MIYYDAPWKTPVPATEKVKEEEKEEAKETNKELILALGTASAVIALGVLAAFAPEAIPVVAEKVAEALMPLVPLALSS